MLDEAGGLCRVFPTAHGNQATNLLVDADDVRAVFVALNPPINRVTQTIGSLGVPTNAFVIPPPGCK